MPKPFVSLKLAQVAKAGRIAAVGEAVVITKDLAENANLLNGLVQSTARGSLSATTTSSLMWRSQFVEGCCH